MPDTQRLVFNGLALAAAFVCVLMVLARRSLKLALGTLLLGGMALSLAENWGAGYTVALGVGVGLLLAWDVYSRLPAEGRKP